MMKNEGVAEQSDLNSAFEMVEAFKVLYHRLDATTCKSGIIESVYHEDMQFEDSFHRIEGVRAFRDYCDSLYENLSYCEFVFHNQWVTEEDAMLTWTMRYVHPRIKGGKEVSVEGATLIRFDQKVYFHRDYFDGGELLYEHIPLMGRLIKTLKNRMT